MRDDSLRERVAAAPQERHLSENTLTAYRRGWLKFDRLVGSLALETLPEERAGIPRGGDPRTKRFQLHTQQNHKVTVPRSTSTAYPPARTSKNSEREPPSRTLRMSEEADEELQVALAQLFVPLLLGSPLQREQHALRGFQKTVSRRSHDSTEKFGCVHRSNQPMTSHCSNLWLRQ